MTDNASWLAIVTNLPTQNVSQRMRILRTLEALGCAVLREGVYLLPDTPDNRKALKFQTETIARAHGSAHVLCVSNFDSHQATAFSKMFDRSREYKELTKTIRSLKAGYGISDPANIAQILAKKRQEFEALAALDFFPSDARLGAEDALLETETEVKKLFFKGKGEAEAAARKHHRAADYQGRTWSTRTNLWADQMACAWLIRRFIDPAARFQWLDKHGRVPPAEGAVTFGYSGAMFYNTGDQVTFQIFVSAFGLNSDDALNRIGQLVNYLVVGGEGMPEASGIETLLRGAKRRADNDNALVAQAVRTFDLIYDAYSEGAES